MFVDYIKYVNFKNEISFNNIIRDSEAMINKESLKINSFYREDYKQDLRMKLFKVLQKNLITINDDFVLYNNEDNKTNKYFKNYLLNANTQISPSLIASDFFLFVGEIKIRAYIRRICYTFSIDYLRKLETDLLFHCISLNNTNDEGNEYLDIIQDKSIQKIELDCTCLEEKLNYIDRLFINGLIQCGTQTEYAKKLNVSQQYVSKRLKMIRSKLKEQFKN